MPIIQIISSTTWEKNALRDNYTVQANNIKGIKPVNMPTCQLYAFDAPLFFSDFDSLYSFTVFSKSWITATPRKLAQMWWIGRWVGERKGKKLRKTHRLYRRVPRRLQALTSSSRRLGTWIRRGARLLQWAVWMFCRIVSVRREPVSFSSSFFWGWECAMSCCKDAALRRQA